MRGTVVVGLLALSPLLMGAADVARYRAPMTPDGLLSLPSTRVLYPLELSATTTFNYAHNPVAWRYPDGSYQPIVQNQLTLDIVASIGVFSLVDVGIGLPVALWQNGFDDTGLGAVSGSGVGDLRLLPRVQLLPERWFGVGVAFISELTFPTGNDARFQGDPGVTWRPQVLASGAIPGLPLRILGALAVRVRNDTLVADVDLSDEMSFNVGAVYAIGLEVPTEVMLELSGVTSFSAPFRSGVSGLELLAGGRVRLWDDWLVTLGGGAGLTQAIGVPQFRIILGAGYMPASADQDGDGIPDAHDDCPDQPEDFDLFQDLDGCAEPDNDGDGLLDVDDQCPNEPEDRDGELDDDGCPEGDDIDSDGDGLLDQDDDCPYEPEDNDHFEDDDGCPELDNDRDGVPDTQDRCPDTKETINGVDDEDGCPDVGEGATQYIENQKIEIKETILFESGKAVIKPESKKVLNQVALQILAHQEIEKIRIEGHTDSLGDDEDNLYLSQDRADAVKRYLASRGVNGARLQAIGYGETRPIDTNATPAGRQRNRRVEFVITSKSQ